MSLINIPEKVELPDCVNNTITNVTDKPSQTIGTIINDILYMASHKLAFQAEAIRIKQQHALEQYKKSLEEKIEQIPEANLAQPNIQLIGTAVDDCQYCLEHKELREMFANLIAASLDTTKSERATPFLSMIIKRLTPYDTLILSLFSESAVQPICKYTAKNASGSVTLQTNVFLEGAAQANIYDVEKRALAISELEALGIVKTNYTDYLVTDSLYEPFSKVEAYREYAQKAETLGNDRKIDIVHGYVALTPTGQQLMEICMPKQA